MTRPAPTSSASSTSPRATRNARSCSMSSRAPPKPVSCRLPSAAACARWRMYARCSASGADKVSINTAAVQRRALVKEAAEKFGDQCIVVAIDAKKVSKAGRKRSLGNLHPWRPQRHGPRCGGLRQGSRGARRGRDSAHLHGPRRDQIRLRHRATRAVADAVTVPVIASGGAGKLDHLVEGIRDGGATAVLAASIFHFGEFTIAEAKRHMAKAGLPVRLDP